MYVIKFKGVCVDVCKTFAAVRITMGENQVWSKDYAIFKVGSRGHSIRVH